MTDTEFISILHREIEASTGCTDPGSICLATANAVCLLENSPEKICITLSRDVYKNAVGVGIPGIYESGIELAAALGVILRAPEKGLAILSDVTEERIAQVRREVAKGYITVTYGETANPLYVKAEVWSGQDHAAAVIAGDYSNVVELSKNGNVLLERPIAVAEEEQYPLMSYTVRELYDFVLSIDTEKLHFLLDYAQKNMDAAQQDLDAPNMKLGRLLKGRMQPGRDDLFSVINNAQAYTAAAGEARMRGMNVTIMSLAGSGNHGITSLIGVLSVARDLHCTEEKTIHALAISAMITVYIKGYIKRMTAFCGCGVAAATGVAAAVVYLLDGTFAQSVHAMQSVLGTLGGMFCDGAKESCAYKLSIATSTAIQYAYLSMQDCYIPERMGIVGATIEQTFANMGRLNDPGMLETDRLLVSIVQNNQKGDKQDEGIPGTSD